MAFRRIIHVDLDAFYVSAELLRLPELRGKPVVVGGSAEGRGVVCASSYEARAFGVRSGIPCRKAQKLCPELIFLPPNFPYYSELSDAVQQIFLRHTDRMEPYSYDEAYLDISPYSRPGEAKQVAQRICAEIEQDTGLTASAGVSYNKFIAKLASDFQKPCGLTLVSPSRARDFIGRQKVGALYGIGRVRSKHLQEQGIHWARDLQQLEEAELLQLFGSYGHFLKLALQGIDERPVEQWTAQPREPKSVGVERTFASDLTLCKLDREHSQEQYDFAQAFFARHQLSSLRTGELPQDVSASELLSLWLYELCLRVSEMLNKRNLAAQSLVIKMRSSDFRVHSRTISWQGATAKPESLFPKAVQAFDELTAKFVGPGAPQQIRLLGLTSRNFHGEETQKTQNWLFEA